MTSLDPQRHFIPISNGIKVNHCKIACKAKRYNSTHSIKIPFQSTSSSLPLLNFNTVCSFSLCVFSSFLVNWIRHPLREIFQTLYHKELTHIWFIVFYRFIVYIYIYIYGDRGSTVVKVLCYKSEGRWFDPSWCQWLFIDIKSFRSHYGPGVDSASNRNEYQEYFLGVKTTGT